MSSLPMVALGLALVGAAAAQDGPSTERAAVPGEQQLALARDAALSAVVDLLVEQQPDSAAGRLLAAAAAAPAPALRWLLLEHAQRVAIAASDTQQALRVADATISGFAVDPVEWMAQRIGDLRHAGAIEPGEVASVWIERLEQATAARDLAVVERLSTRAREAGRAVADPVITAQVDERVAELATWRRLAAGATDLFESGADVAAVTCLSRAAECSKRADMTLDPVIEARLWRREALAWYGSAWPRLDELERRRAVGAMDVVSRKISAGSEFGQLHFDSNDALGDMVFSGGVWRVEGGALRGRNVGDAARATFCSSFRRIRAVTIRGGITSEDGLNFRFVVGPVNAILNWELADENHLWVGDRRTVVSPRRLQAGREHEIVIRDLGGRVAVFVDREPILDAAFEGELVGTVSVYPALGSEIQVREILIDGDVDPGRAVTGPSHESR